MKIVQYALLIWALNAMLIAFVVKRVIQTMNFNWKKSQNALSDLKLCRFYFVENFATASHIVTRTTSRGEVGTSYHFLRPNLFSSKQNPLKSTYLEFSRWFSK